MAAGQSGVAGEIAATINTTFDRLNAVTAELTRIAREVSIEGKLGGQAQVKEVTGSYAQGDTSRKVTVDARGEMSVVKDIVNTLGDRLSSR